MLNACLRQETSVSGADALLLALIGEESDLGRLDIQSLLQFVLEVKKRRFACHFESGPACI